MHVKRGALASSNVGCTKVVLSAASVRAVALSHTGQRDKYM